MADYWKSQPKKFCQYCKCWIADNKPSIEFHERGKNHKENVAAKIAEIKKKSIDKLKQEERMSKEFAAMEEAAMKAYQEDMKRLGIESGSEAQTPAKAQPQPQPQHRPQPQHQPQRQPQRQKKTKKQVSKESRKPAESNAWVEGKTDNGHTYYYNSLSGESKWEKPEGFQGQSSVSAQLGQNESPPGSAWMEAVSPDGYTYYYNSETGESSWERPADLPSKEASGSGSSREGAGQEEPSTPLQEPRSGGEESSNGAQASNEAGGDEQASQEPKVSKISFRKRKVETEPSEKEGEDKGGEGDDQKEDRDEKKAEEETQSTTAEPQKKKEEEKTKAKRPRAFNPYGTWEQIQEEEDPYAKVDLQLPQVEGGAASAPDDLPPEPKPKFKERFVTSLGEEGGPASFRKSKTQNGKSRSLRQRGKDD